MNPSPEPSTPLASDQILEASTASSPSFPESENDGAAEAAPPLHHHSRTEAFPHQQAALDVARLFPFPLDNFQLEAIAALNADRSVVVCAPTGSGKTLVGEYAIYRALYRQRRVFYTTPLKALSNQKLRDFREQFGAEQVGLLTGDVAINRDAPILVMTTEIFRNMLYGTPIGEVGTSLTNVETVVLDECHYMNDRQRGTVWEESVIYCPKEVQLVALSATVANSDQLTDWLTLVHGPTTLVYSDFRPVPLEFHFGNPKGLFPLLDGNNKQINPRLKPKGNRKEQRRRHDSPALAFTVDQLRQRDMLPAIFFIFSRRGCERAVTELDNLSLINEEEARRLADYIQKFADRYPEIGSMDQLSALSRGVASHHAGVLPAWKTLIEELFQLGLIKVVFATETLAAGINMPARTTVISTLSKRTDLGHRLLNPSEFLQMAGRAGRRGMDLIGHVVTLQTPFEGAKEAAYLATSAPDPLVSQFTPSYGMVLNLLQTHTMEEAKQLIECSFGHYLGTLHLQPQRQAIADLEAERDAIVKYLGEIDPQLLASYEKLQERLKEEKRLLKTLQQQVGELQAGDLAAALKFAIPGTILSLKGDNVPTATPLPATLITKISGSGQFPYLVCLGQDNYWYVLTVNDVVGLHGEFPRLVGADHLIPPPEMPLKPGQRRSGSDLSASLVRQIPQLPQLDSDPEVRAQMQQVRACEEQLQSHPLLQYGDLSRLVKSQRRIQSITEDIADRRKKLSDQSERHWQEFINLIHILVQFGCLEEVPNPPRSPRLLPTQLGQSAAAIRGENELWLGLALTSGQLDHLEPHQLATACAALVTESSRPDSQVYLNISPEVDEALQGLQRLRRKLFQLQKRRDIGLPIWMEYDLIALVEHWALGLTWSELVAQTNLDDGDIVRILRRTLDLLSQIPHVPHLPYPLQTQAKIAADLIDRFPVNELAESPGL